MQHHEIIRFEDPDRIFTQGGAHEAMMEAQKAGKIRYVGFTGHKDPLVHLRMLDVCPRPKSALCWSARGCPRRTASTSSSRRAPGSTAPLTIRRGSDELLRTLRVRDRSPGTDRRDPPLLGSSASRQTGCSRPWSSQCSPCG